MTHSKRLTKGQQEEVTRQMVAESRRLTEQGMPIREVAQRVAGLRNDLVQATREGIALTVAPQHVGPDAVQRIETAGGIQYEIRTKAGGMLHVSPEEAYKLLEDLYQWRDSLYNDVRGNAGKKAESTNL